MESDTKFGTYLFSRGVVIICVVYTDITCSFAFLFVGWLFCNLIALFGPPHDRGYFMTLALSNRDDTSSKGSMFNFYVLSVVIPAGVNTNHNWGRNIIFTVFSVAVIKDSFPSTHQFINLVLKRYQRCYRKVQLAVTVGYYHVT